MLYLLIIITVGLLSTIVVIGILNAKIKKKNQLLENLTFETESTNREYMEAEVAHSTAESELKQEIEIATEKNKAFLKKYAPLLDIEVEEQKAKDAVNELKDTLQNLNEKYKAALDIHASLQKDIEIYEETLDINSYGLYQPKYSFDLPEQYLVELEGNYNKQREMVKNHKAVTCQIEWLVGGSKVEGRKMINQSIKLMLFAFNGECDALISKVRWNNVSKARERIIKSFSEINKLGSINQIEIVHEFFDLKLDELSLTYEYDKKKHEQKEEQRLIREQMREEEKAQKEFERVHREAEEESKLYQKVLDKAKQELGIASKEEAEALTFKIRELEDKLKAAQDKKERAISLAQTTKVGNIYIISNVGSFGQNIYKIGMTRRFDPMDRIKELSDAALPFQFDVHAIIYSTNAPQFERELHKKFWDKRINLVNNRKEFFNVSLEEIESCVLEQANTEIQFTKIAEAREYRQTLTLIEQMLNKPVTDAREEKYPQTLLDPNFQ